MIEHKTISLADQVFDKIETDILSGVYARGEILTETKLSIELGVSRTPIREALRRLEQEHLISESGKGSVVIGISEADLEDIFLIRSKIESIVAKMAAENRTEEQLEKLKETVELQEFYLEKQDADRLKIMDNQFHETVYKMSGSTIFYDVLMPLHKKIQKYRKVSVTDTKRAVQSVSEHKAIYDAIASCDGRKTVKLVDMHLKNAYDSIMKKGKE